MAVDYGILSQFKTINDYDNERRARQLQEQKVAFDMQAPERDFAMRQAMFEQESANKQRMFEQEKALKLQLQQMRGQGGQPYVDPETGEMVSPQIKLNATQQKELYDTIDAVNANKSSKAVLGQAQAMNDGSYGGAKPYSGFGSQALAFANRIPLVGLAVDDKRATATTDYNNLVSQQALGSLKEVFGGNPTEGERKILLQMQALPSYNASEQKAILANAQAAADRRLQYNQTKAKAIQTGNYSGLVDGTAAPSSPGKLIGTSGGKKVYQLPDGSHVMEQ